MEWTCTVCGGRMRTVAMAYAGRWTWAWSHVDPWGQVGDGPACPASGSAWAGDADTGPRVRRWRYGAVRRNCMWAPEGDALLPVEV